MVATTTRQAGPHQWAGLALLALPTVLLGLDVTVLYLVLPSMAEALDPSATQTLWIMDAYGFLIAGFLITMGTLGDRIGRRRLLMIGMTAFALTSIFAAFAPSAELLIAARALLGVAGATLMPSTLSLISNMFTDVRQRAVAIGVWATMFALGMASGPIVGGALVDALWWGAAFLVAVPVALIVLLAAKPLLPEYVDQTADRMDFLSVGLSLAAILSGIYAVKQLADTGLNSNVWACAFISVLASVLFVRRQRRLTTPLLDVTLFQSRAFSAALAVLVIGLIGVSGIMYLVTQYLQLVEGLSPLTAGLWMGPPALMMFAAAIGAPLVARRVRPGWVIAGTLGVSVLGYALLTLVGPGNLATVVIGFGFIYFGLGAIAALGTDIVIGAAPAAKSGSAAAMSETAQELGTAFGVALLGSLTTAIYSAHMIAPTQTTPEITARLTESLPSAISVADYVTPAVISQAQAAFTTGLNIAASAAGVAIVGMTALSFIVLRDVPCLESGDDAPTDTRTNVSVDVGATCR